MKLVLHKTYGNQESIKGEYFAHIEDDTHSTVHTMEWGRILSSGCILVLNSSVLFWRLSDYKVSSQCSGQLYLCPVN